MSNRQLDEERIFNIARKIADHEARNEYIDQICAADKGLRERVDALLRVAEEEHSLRADHGGAAIVDHRKPNEMPGTMIGRYKLMEQIGEGGMGTVFVAQQERPLQRKVALKIIKPGMDSNAVIARFEAERLFGLSVSRRHTICTLPLHIDAQ